MPFFRNGLKLSKKAGITFAFLLSFCFGFSQGNWILFNTSNSGIGSNYVTKVKADKNGNIWSTSYYTLSRYDGVKWRVWDLQAIFHGAPFIHDLDIDQNNVVWLATDDGVFRFDGGTTWTNFNESNSGIGFPLVYSVHVAEDNSIWFGDLNSEKISKLSSSGWTNFSIPLGDATPCIDDKDGIYWFASGESLHKFDGTTWTTYDSFNSPLNNGIVSNVAVDSTGMIWLLQGKDFTYNTSGHLANFNGTDWDLYDSTVCPLFYYFDNTIALDSGSVWVGSNGGLFNFDGLTYQLYNTSNSILESNYIHDLNFDKFGNLWIATGTGLAVYNEKEIHIGTPLPNDPSSAIDIMVYPNPSNDFALVVWGNSTFQPTVSLYSMDGRKISSGQYLQSPAILNTGGVAEGCYNVVIQSPQGKTTKKIVVNH